MITWCFEKHAQLIKDYANYKQTHDSGTKQDWYKNQRSFVLNTFVFMIETSSFMIERSSKIICKADNLI